MRKSTGPTIKNFMEHQGLIEKDGKIVEINKINKEKQEKATKDLKKMIEDPDYYPGKEKEQISYTLLPNYSFEEPSDDEINNNPNKNAIDSFTSEEGMYYHDDKVNRFENKDLAYFKKKEGENPELTSFEKESLKKVVQNHIDNKEQFIGKGEEIEKQTNEAVNKFIKKFPEEFVKMIDRKILILGNDKGGVKWKKEIFRKEEFLVSYYPDIKNPIIKFVLDLNEKTKSKQDPIEKVFVNTINKKGGVVKDENGTILVFCSKIVKPKKY